VVSEAVVVVAIEKRKADYDYDHDNDNDKKGKCRDGAHLRVMCSIAEARWSDEL
jgi:hypothetical protein